MLSLSSCGEDSQPPASPAATLGSALPPPASDPGVNFLAIADCFNAPSGQIAACQDAFIANYSEQFGRGSLQMLDDLEAARTLDTHVQSACHPMSHAIGRWVFQRYPTVVDAFEQCNEACHSGCYHGVMERVFQGETDHPTYEDVAAAMPAVCESAQFATSAVEFQCLHGIGHAVMFSLNYDLERSLDVCNLLPNSGGPASCQSAVFMENINAAVPELRDLDPENPHYPCDKVADQYVDICYGMQTSVMYSYGLTDEDVARECSEGAGDHSAFCMRSFGRDLSSHARVGNGERVRYACENLAGEFAKDCVWGAVAALDDNSWNGSFSIPLCTLIEGDELRNTCYYQVYWHLVQRYEFDDAGWALQCEAYAGDGLEMCLAQIPAP
jgi:hypothetical protein